MEAGSKVRVSFGVADLVAKPAFNSTRISQLIYGENIEAESSDGAFVPVYYQPSGDLKRYALKKLLAFEEDGEERRYKLKQRVYAGGLSLPFGSYLSEQEVEDLRIDRGLLADVSEKFQPAELAPRFLGVPYLTGGTSDFGFDCSGFIQRLFRFCGIEIPRKSKYQQLAGKEVENWNQVEPNDLIFFLGHKRSEVSHVGLYVGKNEIIHSSQSEGGVVRTDLSDGSKYSQDLNLRSPSIGRFE